MDISSMFLGVTPREMRAQIFRIVNHNHENYDRFVMPCVGRFAVAETFVRAGAPADKLITSEVSLFSSLLGFLFAGYDLAELKVNVTSPELDFLNLDMTDPVKFVAELLFAMKYCQVKGDAHYYNDVRRELIFNHEKYIRALADNLKMAGDILLGIHYEIKGIHDVIDEERSGKTLIFFDPPIVAGYAKMFDFTGKISWRGATFKDFDINEPAAYLELIYDSPATILSSHYAIDRNLEKHRLPEKWEKVFCRKIDANRRDYLLTNKPIEHSNILIRRYDRIQPCKYPQFGENDKLNKFSKVRWISLTKDEATYYRNLWVHRLPGTTSAELTLGLLIDGKILAIAGFFTSQATRSNLGYIHETFGICAPLKRFHRIQRLFIRLMLSKEFKRDLHSFVNLSIYKVAGIKTTYLSRTPEARFNRALMKLVNRERMKDGIFKLNYYSDFTDKTYRQNIIEFNDEENRRTQLIEKRKRVTNDKI